jgi:EmrB/QacA subfamily drug resistance transporter
MDNSAFPKSRSTLWIVALGTFMCSFDLNAVNMALPLMQKAFSAPTAIVEWVVVAYLLTLSSLLLGFGRLGDIGGLKRVFVGGFAIFTLASICCALSPSIEVLISCVTIQGLGAAMLMSTSNAVLVAAVPPERRGRALGALSIAIALATCAGPSLGGLIATRFGWKGVYLANLPLGLLGTIAAATLIADRRPSSPDSPGRRFDLAGCLLGAAFLAATVLPLDLLSASMSAGPLLLLALAALLAVAFVAVERRARQPLLDLALFKSKAFAAGNLAALLFFASEFAMVFLAPFFLQRMAGLSPTQAGLTMLPMSIALMAVAPLSGALSDRIDGRVLGCAGLVLIAAAELAFSLARVQASSTLRILAFAAVGVGIGLFTPPNTSAVMGSAPRERRGVAGATLATMKNVGMVLGEAVSAMILSSVMAARGEALGQGSGTAAWGGAFETAMRGVCIAAAGAALLAALLTTARSTTQPEEPGATDSLGRSEGV